MPLICSGPALASVEIMDDFAERPWMGSQRLASAGPLQVDTILSSHASPIANISDHKRYYASN